MADSPYFDATYFDGTYFDVNTTGGGRGGRVLIYIPEPLEDDDNVFLLILPFEDF